MINAKSVSLIKLKFAGAGITKEINYVDGFTIIGTMNLIVNGMAFGLPEPLVDRCSDIQKFVLKAEDLMAAL